ncbi:riboflavin biosynthesis protein RibF [Caproiciproducens galactitolivorans]|uniref:Riboflavin biosynthesis protein n=1 Tax=Caproiciproducens galactitolivorans TaxID=642589 RepID=A0A4Z0YBN1_9FIRM|nr:riboflavin biosynthesis protein RibF [Caproiciproducens galactitolivorans]QEY35132.1 riboflavin biosynthesis protein RibF [Caproiciproducens galactitolivorans]TGJ76641.1 riboflavin biosynthesis protein RibF [Caproiciproducens galactitolivorans]
MRINYDLTPALANTAVALGSFDGLHVGHQKVIGSAVEAKKDGLLPAVLTFARNPLADLGGCAGGEILSQEQKIHILEKFGVEQLYILNFSTIKDYTPEEFVDRVLIRVCHAKQVCCGFNFTFGCGGKGNSHTLEQLCGERGLKTKIAEAVLLDGDTVSSTRIRGLIANGDVDEAARLLGRPYGYRSPVLHGRKLGRRLGTPTLNQAIPKNFVLPRFGVYVSRAVFGGKEYCGVTNVGIKPTVGSPCVLAETWLPDYSGEDFYGKTVRVDLMKFLRPEKKFAGLDELRAEIHKNGEQAKEYFQKNRAIFEQGI